MAIFTFNPNEKNDKPTAKLFANVGTSEPFVARTLGLNDIVDATDYNNREKIKEAILYILFDCIVPAHLSLGNIRKHETETNMPELNKQKDYIDLYNHLWTAYKDRTQKVFEGTAFNIGFLFQNDTHFNKGLQNFKSKFPEINQDFFDSITEDRNSWQKIIETIRNDYNNHKKIELSLIKQYFTLENAEILFYNVWTAIEEIIVEFLMQGFKMPGIQIVEIPEDQRNPQIPKRYRFVMKKISTS